MNTEENKKIKIRFRNGEVRTLLTAYVGDEVLEEFEQLTGTLFVNDMSLYEYVKDESFNWFKKHGFASSNARKLLVLTDGLFALGFASQTEEAIVTFAEEDWECILLFNEPDRNQIKSISTFTYVELTGRLTDEYGYETVEFLGEGALKTITDELTVKLNSVVNAEDYEMAAIIRDRIIMLNS